MEQGGVSLKRKLTGGDLTAGGQPDCELCKSGLKGCCHRRACVLYRGTCNNCEENYIPATYYGKVGFLATIDQIFTKRKLLAEI